MKTPVRKSLAYLLTLSLTAFTASLVQADWLLDFELPEPLPPEFQTFGARDLGGTPSATLQTSTDSGVLRFYDDIPVGQGGTFSACGWMPEVFTDVRVTATINADPSRATDNCFYVGARVAPEFPDVERGYLVGFGYGSEVAGAMGIFKFRNQGDGGPVANSDWVGLPRVTDLASPYVLQADVVNNEVTGFPEITGRLFDLAGNQLMTLSYTDTGSQFGPPIPSGLSFVEAIAWNVPRLDGTFDDVSSVPEPSTLVLAAIGAVTLLAAACWRRKRAAKGPAESPAPPAENGYRP